MIPNLAHPNTLAPRFVLLALISSIDQIILRFLAIENCFSDVRFPFRLWMSHRIAVFPFVLTP
ncbi:hypothetical protein NDI45_06055 [Leptolyngbya sp. GB1-A1]|uniref:hypothetical protein n=1 Tax=Leptolyngbya sp. GB1-A1 TaxID=2933908 RepID=UPI0032995447